MTIYFWYVTAGSPFAGRVLRMIRITCDYDCLIRRLGFNEAFFSSEINYELLFKLYDYVRHLRSPRSSPVLKITFLG